MDVRFYYLQSEGFVKALGALLEKIIAKSYRCLILTKNEDQRISLNQQLWTYRSLAFLPHGTWEDPEELRAMQPIWLSCIFEAFNHPQVVVMLNNQLFFGSTGLSTTNQTLAATITHLIDIVMEDDPQAMEEAKVRIESYGRQGYVVQEWHQNNLR